MRQRRSLVTSVVAGRVRAAVGRPPPARRRSGARIAATAGLTAALLVLVAVTVRGITDSPAAGLGAAASPTNPVATATPTPTTAPSLGPSPGPSPAPMWLLSQLRPGPVVIDTVGWASWALMDTRTGRVVGSSNADETTWTASMIKAWIAADFLRREAAAGRSPSATRLDQLRRMIRDSDNLAADSLFAAVSRTESIRRLVSICQLTDGGPSLTGGWSKTRLSARDAARMGDCIGDGRAAGRRWTEWLLGEMRAVRGGGDFGIRAAFPAPTRSRIAIKNGWVDRAAQGEYHVNCLAVGDGWVLAVLNRYPLQRNQVDQRRYGAAICQDVARQLGAG